ncbi:putative white-collar-1c protein [Helicostylum pulchrum]|nr:putative white-collar-1c protein [Helicostylum pulchrum]
MQTDLLQDNSVQRSALTGVYSNTGFDMIQILSKLTSRPNPQIQLGPIDLSCSFVVSDANQYDCPVVYCSPAFERLTGYTNAEIVGKNCRFLQSPDGLVTGGSRRQHTDNQAVYHLKAQLNMGKEHQASIINYKKGGQPFVNLVTVVPIFAENGCIDYFVGLQVDLVEQPNSILDKMKDGTYLINYHYSVNQPPIPTQGDNLLLGSMDEYFREVPSNNASKNANIINLLDSTQIDFENLFTSEQQIQKEWHKVLLNQTCDFIHVISLKGIFMYVSDASVSMLEYDPTELLGSTLSSICHPSDIIPVMREIKEAAANPDKVINLLFRIRRKLSGYFWIECRGKLHMDLNKGRKCLVLSGRERPVYRLSTSNPPHADEYWAKLSLSGLYLHVTRSCKDIVGFTNDALEHQSIYQYIENDSVTDITRALQSVSVENKPYKVQHTMLTAKGTYVNVFGTFYPGDTLNNQRNPPSFILVQVQLSSTTHSTLLSSSVITSTNLFPELETVRTTNWQYELYQLEQSNQKLRDQLEKYANPNNKKQRRKKKTSIEAPKMCVKCQRKDSPEWRKGPNGPKELCNACGLRYAKSLNSKNKK